MYHRNQAVDRFMPSFEMLRNVPIFLKNFQRSEPGHLSFGTDRTLCCQYYWSAIYIYWGVASPHSKFNPTVELMLNILFFLRQTSTQVILLLTQKTQGLKILLFGFPYTSLVVCTTLFFFHIIRYISIFLQLNIPGPQCFVKRFIITMRCRNLTLVYIS